MCAQHARLGSILLQKVVQACWSQLTILAQFLKQAGSIAVLPASWQTSVRSDEGVCTYIKEYMYS